MKLLSFICMCLFVIFIIINILLNILLSYLCVALQWAECFQRTLKTLLIASHWCSSAHLRFHDSALYKFALTLTFNITNICHSDFIVNSPSVWNFLLDYLRDPSIDRDTFRRHLKMFMLASYERIQRIRGFTFMCCINVLHIVIRYCKYLLFILQVFLD